MKTRCRKLIQNRVPGVPAIRRAGSWLKDHGLMPGYGQIYVRGTTAWYVGGDGDEDGFGNLVVSKLKGLGFGRVVYEAEAFPPRNDGWVLAYRPGGSDGPTVNPFVSEAQRRACHAAHDPRWDCPEWEQATEDKGKKLPERKSSKARKSAKKKLTANRGKVRSGKGGVGPNKVDPTRTVTLRRWMAAEVRKRFGALKGRVYKLVVAEDAFGLLPKQPLSFNEFGPDQQRDEHGKWTVAGAALSAVVDSVKAAGALATHVEHVVSAYVRDRVGQAVARLPSPVQAVANGAFVGGKALSAVAFANWTLGQNLAERVSRERGATEEEARRLRGVLSAIDSKTFEALKVTALVGVHAAHLPAVVAGTVPAATTAYLCYSTARDPLATIRAATKMVKGLIPEQRLAGNKAVVNAVIDQAHLLDHSLLAHGYDDWYIALLSAALDRKGSVAEAVELANGLYQLGSQQSVTVPSTQRDDGQDLFAVPSGAVYNTRWQFATSAEKVGAFQDWLRAQVKDTITSVSDEELWHRYIEAGFKKGAGRSYDDVKRKAVAAGGQDALDFYGGTRDEFLKDSFAQPVTREKVELLAGRAYDDLEGVTEDMGLRMSRSLADGLVQGKSPLDVAQDLNDDLELGKDRSVLIARTEIIRAHAEGQLTALESLGVDEIGVAVEWSSTGDGKVCPQCQPLQGVVLTVDEARGLLPRHPQCRCAFTPANVGEDEGGQKRSKPDIDTALKESVDAEVAPKVTGKGKKGVPAKPRESDWAGADLDVGERRPVQEPLTPLDVSNLADMDLLSSFQESVDNAQREFFAECWRDDKGRCMAGEGSEEGGSSGKAPAAEHDESRKLAEVKIANAPVPSPEKKAAYSAKVEKYLAAVKKAREEGTKEPQQREFLDARGNTGDRKRRAQQLFKEFGGDENGYVVCPWTGIKMHWTDDPAVNPHGHPRFEQGKIFTAVQGGGYQLANLIPESFTANRARGNTPARTENL